jgi:hypothetical protein
VEIASSSQVHYFGTNLILREEICDRMSVSHIDFIKLLYNYIPYIFMHSLCLEIQVSGTGNCKWQLWWYRGRNHVRIRISNVWNVKRRELLVNISEEYRCVPFCSDAGNFKYNMWRVWSTGTVLWVSRANIFSGTKNDFILILEYFSGFEIS